MSNQQADMRQHEQEMREAFEAALERKFLVMGEVKHYYHHGYIFSVAHRHRKSCYADGQILWELWQSATLAAEARIRELEADAKRYRWLRDKSEYGDDFYLSVPFESPKDTFKPHEVDEAIDAALTEHKENQG